MPDEQQLTRLDELSAEIENLTRHSVVVDRRLEEVEATLRRFIQAQTEYQTALRTMVVELEHEVEELKEGGDKDPDDLAVSPEPEPAT